MILDKVINNNIGRSVVVKALAAYHNTPTYKIFSWDKKLFSQLFSKVTFPSKPLALAYWDIVVTNLYVVYAYIIGLIRHNQCITY